MKIIQCLLNIENTIQIGNETVGEKIQRLGKQHLWSERQAETVDTIVVHYMSAINLTPDDPFNLETILDIFCTCGVSSHYLIDREGFIYQLVNDAMKAWHCGGSVMPEPDSRQGVNDFSIGIELVALPASGFTDEQYEALAFLCADREKVWPIRAYMGHEDVAGVRAVRMELRNDVKIDPGPLFDWQRFYMLKSSSNVAIV